MSVTAPVSLFTCINDTTMVPGRNAFERFSGVIVPVSSGLTWVVVNPCVSNQAVESRTARCSSAETTMWSPRSRRARAAPFKAKLMASVAPEVQTTSSGCDDSSAATSPRALSMASDAAWPKAWVTDAGFPKVPSTVRKSLMVRATAGSTGVVAA